jgi:hypothetical protein
MPKEIKYPPYPLGDRVRFQLKSRMSGNRALFWRNHVGGNQFRTYIQDNNPADSKQWWSFDTRTKSIRAFAKKSHVLSGKIGSGFRRGSMVVIRPYKGENIQKIWWYNKSRQNVKFGGKICLDVHGGRNVNNRHVIYWSCHNGLNQAWYVDQTAFTYPKQPLKDGVKFQLKSKMATFRALFWAEHIGGQQYRLRIRNDLPKDNKQWYTFDRRSRTIRAWSSRNMAISNQAGQGFRIGRAAVIRTYKNEVYQKIAYYRGKFRNVRNNGQKCLDVHGG